MADPVNVYPPQSPQPAPQAAARPQIPLAMNFNPGPQFPPDVQAKLQAAKASGNYWIAIGIGKGGPDSVVEVFQSRSEQFNPDWVARCLQTLIGQLFTPVVAPPIVQQHPPAQQSTLG